jgi:SAM-dependent methyltransferase
MAFNSLMIRLTAEVMPMLPSSAKVVELGNQRFRPRHGIMAEVAAYLKRECPSWSDDDLMAINERTGESLEESTADYMKSIGYGGHTCIDVNQRFGALQMDLNYSLADKYGFDEEFDLVTNNGTGEHIFDQASVFRNVHALTRTGGVMIHVLPFHNYVNHGFYNVQPILFHDLAQANQYKILRISLADKDGKEIAFGAEETISTTRTVKTYPLNAVLDRTIAWPGLHDLKSRTIKRSMRPIAKAMRSLSSDSANVLIVAVLQKTRDDAFRIPMQGMYAGANISSETIATDYANA